MSSTSRILFPGIPLLLTVASVFAQVPSALIGNWVIHWADHRPERSVLIVTDSGGTWQTQISEVESYLHKDPCIGRRVPIAVQPLQESQFLVRLKFSAVIAGCSDASLKVGIGGDGSISGMRGKHPLTFVRD
jgi:hypothetical protein